MSARPGARHELRAGRHRSSLPECSEDPCTPYGSEGWGFESLRARSPDLVGLAGLIPFEGLARTARPSGIFAPCMHDVCSEGVEIVWKQTGQPTVQRQRERWVVRVEGIDTETGKRRPRQIGTFSSRRSAQAAATSVAASGGLSSDRDTVGYLVDRWVAGKLDVSNKTRLQYEWAAGHIKAGLGAVRVDRLERDDVARWLDGLATGGSFSRRSIQIFRMVLRAVLDDAVVTGELRRSPAARVGMPRQVTKAGPRARNRCLDRGRAPAVPRRDRRPPLGGACSLGGALWVATQ